MLKIINKSNKKKDKKSSTVADYQYSNQNQKNLIQVQQMQKHLLIKNYLIFHLVENPLWNKNN